MNFSRFFFVTVTMLALAPVHAEAQTSPAKPGKFMRYYEVSSFTACPPEVLKTLPRLGTWWPYHTGTASAHGSVNSTATFKDSNRKNTELKYYEMKDGQCVTTTLPASSARTENE